MKLTEIVNKKDFYNICTQYYELTGIRSITYTTDTRPTTKS
jgi:hypothetical protein